MLRVDRAELQCLLDRNPPVYWPGDLLTLTLGLNITKKSAMGSKAAPLTRPQG